MAASQTSCNWQTARIAVAATCANAVAGLIYVWSLFILPIEATLGLHRGWLGMIPSISLVCFTLSVWSVPRVLAKLGLVGALALAFALIAGGHISFGLAPSGIALILGYGICFGLGAGVAYGCALALASRMPDGMRARAIGVILACFALSGLVLPSMLGDWIASTDPAHAFWLIGMGTLIPGALSLFFLRGIEFTPRREVELPSGPIPAVDRAFWLLTLVFFCVCFVGLAIISQVAAIAAASAIPSSARAATALTCGYLPGSLLGAPLADKTRERSLLALLPVLAGVGVMAMWSGTTLPFLTGAALVGLALGGSGSILPVMIGRRYGAALIPAVYGRMMLAYGLAGLFAPWLAGLLFASAGSYDSTLFLCLALAAFALVVPSLIPLRPIPGAPLVRHSQSPAGHDGVVRANPERSRF